MKLAAKNLGCGLLASLVLAAACDSGRPAHHPSDAAVDEASGAGGDAASGSETAVVDVPGKERPPAPLPSSSMVNGDGGGQISSGDGVTVTRATVTIPELALPADMTITVKALAPEGLPESDRILGFAYEMGPTGTKFALPVEITLSLTDPIPAGKVAQIAWLNGATSTWVALASTVVGMEVRAFASHFTTFAVLLYDPPDIALSPATFSFAGTPTGTFSTSTRFTVTNTGTPTAALLTVAAAVAVGEFVVLTNSCDVGVAPGDHCQLRVRFGPKSSGAKTGVLTVSTGTGATAMATLAGTGTTNPCDTMTCKQTDAGYPTEVCVQGKCGSPVLTTLLVWPEIITLPVDQNYTLRALAIYNDGTVEEVTNRATWTSNKITSATFNDTNHPSKITTIAAGSLRASAEYGGLIGGSMITVR